MSHRVGVYCLYGQNFFSETSNKKGGAEKQSAYCAKFLADSGVEVAFLMADPGKSKRIKELYPGIKAFYNLKYTVEGGVKKRKYKAGFLQRIRDKVRSAFGLKALNVTKDNLENAMKAFSIPSVSFWMAHYLSDPLNELALFCRANKIPFLLALASDFDLDFLEISSGRDQFGACREKKRNTLEMSNFVLVQNRWQEKVVKDNFPQKPCFYLPNPVAIPPLQKGSKNYKTLLWIGKFDENKNPKAVINLAIKLPELNFLMIANPADKKIENEIRTSKPANLKIIQSVPVNEMHTFYQSSSIHLSTSLKEGFPNTFLEAAATGIPTFSLNVDPDGLMTNSILGQHFEGNLDAMASTIRMVIANPDLLNEMGLKARSYVEAVHDSEKVNKRWLEIVDDVLNLSCVE